MNMRKITSEFALAFLLLISSPFAAPAFAQGAQAAPNIKVDAQAAVAPFIEAIQAIAKEKLKDQNTLIDNVIKILTTSPPADASDTVIENFSTAQTLAVNKILSAYPIGTAIRVRETTLVDMFQTSATNISIQLVSNASIPVNFGFNLGKESRTRAVSEIEFEGTFGFNESFVPGFTEVIRGDNAIAIMRQLGDILTAAQAQ